MKNEIEAPYIVNSYSPKYSEETGKIIGSCLESSKGFEDFEDAKAHARFMRESSDGELDVEIVF